MARVHPKSKEEIALMRESCRIVAEVLALVGTRIRAGVRAEELDAFAEEYIRSKGAVPAFKGYGPDKQNLFPGTLCVSIDAEVVHGMPDGRGLEEGQIVSIDVGVHKDGYFGDGARTFAVGRIAAAKDRLLRVTEEALGKAIEQVRPGNHVGDISAAIQGHVESRGFSAVRDFVGHGIGKFMHERPQIPNFGLPGRGVRLKPGMILAIEPMINAGGYAVEILEDGWTAVTRDRSLSAHFEHSVAVTENGPYILSQL